MSDARDAMNSIRKTLNDIDTALAGRRFPKAFDIYVNSDLEGNVRALGTALAAEVQKLALEAKRNRDLGRTI